MAIDSFFMLLIPEKSSMSSIIGQSSPNLNSWLRIGRVAGRQLLQESHLPGFISHNARIARQSAKHCQVD
jgi:hypothetical protein